MVEKLNHSHQQRNLDTVSTTCGSGWVRSLLAPRMSTTYPPATAGGTDRIQEKLFIEQMVQIEYRAPHCSVPLSPKGAPMDLGILNTIIALVVVLLVLSLLVQSIQTLLKKILKLKSRQIEDSLKDLYEQVVSAPVETTPSTPVLSNLWSTIKSWFGRK